METGVYQSQRIHLWFIILWQIRDMPEYRMKLVSELRAEIDEIRKQILASRRNNIYEAERDRVNLIVRLEDIKTQLRFRMEQHKRAS